MNEQRGIPMDPQSAFNNIIAGLLTTSFFVARGNSRYDHLDEDGLTKEVFSKFGETLESFEKLLMAQKARENLAKRKTDPLQ